MMTGSASHCILALFLLQLARLPAGEARPAQPARRLMQLPTADENMLLEFMSRHDKWYYWNCSHESFFPHACKEGEPLWRPPVQPANATQPTQPAHARRLLQTTWAEADMYLVDGQLVHRAAAEETAARWQEKLYNMYFAVAMAQIATYLFAITLAAVAFRKLLAGETFEPRAGETFEPRAGEKHAGEKQLQV